MLDTLPLQTMAHEELLLLINYAFPGINLPLLVQIADVISIAPAGMVTHCDFIQLTSRETSTQLCWTASEIGPPQCNQV